MNVIETNHFMARWKCRVGRYSYGYRKLIIDSGKQGRARRHKNEKLGVLVPVKIGKRTHNVLGILTEEKFILKTVMSDRMALNMGWSK